MNGKPRQALFLIILLLAGCTTEIKLADLESAADKYWGEDWRNDDTYLSETLTVRTQEGTEYPVLVITKRGSTTLGTDWQAVAFFGCEGKVWTSSQSGSMLSGPSPPDTETWARESIRQCEAGELISVEKE